MVTNSTIRNGRRRTTQTYDKCHLRFCRPAGTSLSLVFPNCSRASSNWSKDNAPKSVGLAKRGMDRGKVHPTALLDDCLDHRDDPTN